MIQAVADKVADEIPVGRAVVKDTLHRPDVHAAKSVMVMADVALVIAGHLCLAERGDEGERSLPG
jgi:hypothetical protein